MASYSTDANVQNMAYGATNTDIDTATTAARDVATSIINAHLNRVIDIPAADVSDAVTRCCTLLAAGILTSSPEDRESNTYWKAGMALLNSLHGDSSEDAKYRINIPVDRF